MNKKKKIIIIGGGFAGVFSAKHIAKQFRNKDVDIELISYYNYFIFQPLLPEVSSGIINPNDVVTPLRMLIPNIKHRMAAVHKIDQKNKQIELSQGECEEFIKLDYDELVIACGKKSSLNLPGFASHTFVMKDLGDAFRLKNHIISCLELADATLNQKLKKEILTFVVVGAGFSGVETIGELQDTVKRALKHYPNIEMSEIKFLLLQRNVRILLQLSEKLATYAHKKLEKRGVDIRVKTNVVRATKEHIELNTGEIIHTQTVITTIGSGTRDFIKKSFNLEKGSIPVNKYMQSTEYKNIWALGDVALIPLDKEKSGEDFAPPTAQFAVREGKILSKNLYAEMFGGKKQAFNYKPLGLMASIGSYQGVAEIRGVIISGFIAWAMWRSVYLIKLPGFVTKFRVFMNWATDYFFPRALVQVSPVVQKSINYEHYAKGDIIRNKGDLITHFSLIIQGSVQRWDDEHSEVLKEQDNLCIKTEFEIYKRTFTALEDSIIMTIPKKDFAFLKNSFSEFKHIFDNRENR
jgi:NADH dehydrogenase